MPAPDDQFAYAAVSDAGQLRGEWEVIGCIINGGDETSLYMGDRWAFAGPAAQRNGSNPYEVRADPSARPMTLDLTTRSGKVRGGTYRLSGAEMRWVVGHLLQGGRPPSFEPAPRRRRLDAPPREEVTAAACRPDDARRRRPWRSRRPGGGELLT